MRKQKSLILFTYFCNGIISIPTECFCCKEESKTEQKTVTVNVGKTVKIKLQNNKKKVKWTVTSGKKKCDA